MGARRNTATRVQNMLHGIRRLSLWDTHTLHAQGSGTACQRAEPRGRPVYVKHRIVHRAHTAGKPHNRLSAAVVSFCPRKCVPNPGQFTHETKRPIRARHPGPGCGLHGLPVPHFDEPAIRHWLRRAASFFGCRRHHHRCSAASLVPSCAPWQAESSPAWARAGGPGGHAVRCAQCS